MELEQAFFILEHGSDEGIKEYLKAIKTIKENCVPVVHGHWLKIYHEFYTDIGKVSGTYPTCSRCGDFQTGFEQMTNYCHGCGAKMDENEVNV